MSIEDLCGCGYCADIAKDYEDKQQYRNEAGKFRSNPRAMAASR